MSMLWLVTPNDEWGEESHHVFAGMFATRRIASLQSFHRIAAATGYGQMERVFVIIRLVGDENDFTLHSSILGFIANCNKAQLVCVGSPTENHKRILDALGVAFLSNHTDHLRLAQLIKVLMSEKDATRSGAISHGSKLRFGDIEVDVASGLFRILATDIKEQLSPKETRILQVLAGSVNEQVTRDDLVGKVWSGLKVSSSTVDSHMSRLRKKLDQSFECALETEYGSGWKLTVKA